MESEESNNPPQVGEETANDVKDEHAAATEASTEEVPGSSFTVDLMAEEPESIVPETMTSEVLNDGPEVLVDESAQSVNELPAGWAEATDPNHGQTYNYNSGYKTWKVKSSLRWRLHLE